MLRKEKFEISDDDRKTLIADYEETNKNGCVWGLAALALIAVSGGFFLFKVVPKQMPSMMIGLTVILILFGTPVLIWAVWFTNKWKNHGLDLFGTISDKWYETGKNETYYDNKYFKFGDEKLLVHKEVYEQAQIMYTNLHIRTWPKWGLMKLMNPQEFTFDYQKIGVSKLNEVETEKMIKYVKFGKYKRASLNQEFKNDYSFECVINDLYSNCLDLYEAYVVEKNKNTITGDGVNNTTTVTQYWLILSIGKFHVSKEDFEKIPFGTKVLLQVLPQAGVLVPAMKIGENEIEAKPVPNGKNNHLNKEYSEKTDFD